MISKIKFIPRAAADIIKVLLHKNISLAKRWAIAKALYQIKWAAVAKQINEPFVFYLDKWKIHCLYNKHIGFLLKEIFAENVYAIKKNEGVKKVLDLGSNIGLSIAFFKLHHPAASIDAYEPDKNSFQLLQKNITANSWVNITANELAISDKNGFLFASLSQEKASVNSNFVREGAKPDYQVKAIDIADVLKQKYDVIKMDIEGGEWQLFKKIIADELLNSANNWFIEFHNIEAHNQQFNEILQCFEQKGFIKEERKAVFYFYKNI